ncbi:hypothetical protein CDL15_Pgr016651 [Punica granatum]|uniref:Uncharacterized protein n=1 Tax=Punica granatum TaxID=22663 RepID=A0A218XTD6_PUNGR|nr:hypothetical protein CDL15_Pgr016651 [Punica granatum]
MSSEQADARDQESGNHSNSTRVDPEESMPTRCSSWKVMVKRALFRSGRRSVSRRKSYSDAANSLPSRLSKVSLADDQ